MPVKLRWGDQACAHELSGAIVDLDGTMVDTIGDFTKALNLMLGDLHQPQLSVTDVKPMVGKGTEHLLRSALGVVLARAGQSDQGLNAAIEAVFPQAMQRYMQHYLVVNGRHSAVYPGVIQGLSALKNAGLKLACVTNKPLAFTKPLLEAKGLDSFFDVVFGGDSFECKKPDPLPLLKACDALVTEPAYTLMIGDSINDAQAARAAGCPVILVTYGYNHGKSVTLTDADGWVDRFTQLQIE